MRKRVALALTFAWAFSPCLCQLNAQAMPSQGRQWPRPQQATRCDLTVPLQVVLTPLNAAKAGRTVRFSVNIESHVDPDLVKSMWLEYEVPERMRPPRAYAGRREVPRLVRSGRQELELLLPDEGRYHVRARLVVELWNGKTISKTATHWINPENALPEGMVGRIVAPDGTAIRVYQGLAGKN